MDHRPIDAETLLFNALADSHTLGPFTWVEDRPAAKEKEEELEDMVAHILASLLQYYQMTKRDEPLKPIWDLKGLADDAMPQPPHGADH